MTIVPAGHVFRFADGSIIARARVPVNLSRGYLSMDDFESPFDLTDLKQRLPLTSALVRYCTEDRT